MYLIVNGLTRGGTNLVSSYISGLPGCVCTDIRVPAFMFDAISQMESKRGLSLQGIDRYTQTLLLHEKAAFEVILGGYDFWIDKYRVQFETYYGISVNDWLSHLADLRLCHNDHSLILSEIGTFASQNGLQVIGGRYTAITHYASSILDQSEGQVRWIEIVRDPWSRYLSGKRGHGLSLLQSVEGSYHQQSHLPQLEHREDCLVLNFEEFIRDPKKIAARIGTFLNLDLSPSELANISVVTPDLKPSSGNSSDNSRLFQQKESNLGMIYGAKTKLEATHEMHRHESIFIKFFLTNKAFRSMITTLSEIFRMLTLFFLSGLILGLFPLIIILFFSSIIKGENVVQKLNNQIDFNKQLLKSFIFRFKR